MYILVFVIFLEIAMMTHYFSVRWLVEVRRTYCSATNDIIMTWTHNAMYSLYNINVIQMCISINTVSSLIHKSGID